MYNETLPTIERPEFDRALWSEWQADQPVRSDSDWMRLHQGLGHLALEASIVRSNSGTHHQLYLRGNDRLSADDIRELESYFEFLRQQFGVPESASIFPKRDPEPPTQPAREPEDDDEA